MARIASIDSCAGLASWPEEARLNLHMRPAFDGEDEFANRLDKARGRRN